MGKDQAAGPELNRLGTPLDLEQVGSQFLSLRHILLKYKVNCCFSMVTPGCFWAGQALESQRDPL
jgi:hypothetical protein